MLHVKIENKEEIILVNDVEISKSHLLTIFPGDEERSIAKFLAVCPVIIAMADHFRDWHDLSESAVYALEIAPKLMEAIGITDDTVMPFIAVCLAQAGEGPDEIIGQCHKAFGNCRKSNPEVDGNVITFPQRNGTLH